jgi:hypothetical protein
MCKNSRINENCISLEVKLKNISLETEKNHLKCTINLIYKPSYDKLKENVEQKSYR